MTTTYDENLVSDLHKDAYGFRPREGFWARWETLSEQERQAEWDSLMAEARRSAAEDERRADDCEARANDEIAMVRRLVGCDAASAVRHLHDAYGTDGDDGFLEYSMGVRYGYLAAVKAA